MATVTKGERRARPRVAGALTAVGRTVAAAARGVGCVTLPTGAGGSGRPVGRRRRLSGRRGGRLLRRSAVGGRPAHRLAVGRGRRGFPAGRPPRPDLAHPRASLRGVHAPGTAACRRDGIGIPGSTGGSADRRGSGAAPGWGGALRVPGEQRAPPIADRPVLPRRTRRRPPGGWIRGARQSGEHSLVLDLRGLLGDSLATSPLVGVGAGRGGGPHGGADQPALGRVPPAGRAASVHRSRLARPGGARLLPHRRRRPASGRGDHPSSGPPVLRRARRARVLRQPCDPRDACRLPGNGMGVADRRLGCGRGGGGGRNRNRARGAPDARSAPLARGLGPGSDRGRLRRDVRRACGDPGHAVSAGRVAALPLPGTAVAAALQRDRGGSGRAAPVVGCRRPGRALRARRGHRAARPTGDAPGLGSARRAHSTVAERGRRRGGAVPGPRRNDGVPERTARWLARAGALRRPGGVLARIEERRLTPWSHVIPAVDEGKGRRPCVFS
ncbi:LigA [Acidothermus cellulolyticus 11B]|uniref:LigA n=1 Tax=Acidothermus cellulolyticus (strain ATCC 43068 / DSM 8971 / 11B) TaxID=351607 RepID=A0LRX8_ACIC1|nr:LigA [Acidothermus cellulolyticus 11B]